MPRSFVKFAFTPTPYLMTFVRSVVILIFLFATILKLEAQQSNWAESHAPKRCKVIIPSYANLMLPSTDRYQIGFFILENNSFVNVGSTTYDPGQGQQTIFLGYDELGNIGYQQGQQLITLVRNTSNQNLVYGIEFIYENNANTFILDGTITILGLKYATFQRIMGSTVCQSIGDLELKIPYGLRPSVNSGAAIKFERDSHDRYIFHLDEMQGNMQYAFTITSPYVVFTELSYSFDLAYFPLDQLNTQLEICPGSIFTLPSYIPSHDLTRTPSTNSTLTISSEGNHIYQLQYGSNSCVGVDTVTVKFKSNCAAQTDYPSAIDPSKGQEIVFVQPESINIYDAAMNSVNQLQAPCIWKGTDRSGNMLQPGLYFIIHEDGSTHDLTLIY